MWLEKTVPGSHELLNKNSQDWATSLWVIEILEILKQYKQLLLDFHQN